MDGGLWSGAAGNVIGGVLASALIAGAVWIVNVYARRGAGRLFQQFERTRRSAVLAYGYAAALLVAAFTLMVARSPASGVSEGDGVDGARLLLWLCQGALAVTAVLGAHMVLLLAGAVRSAFAGDPRDRARREAHRRIRAQWQLSDEDEIY